jgi:hypothetical protein
MSLSNTHLFLTSQGLAILRNDLGKELVDTVFPTDDDDLVRKFIRGGADPDDQERDFVDFFPTYQGHFFNPNTGKNYCGNSAPTALTRFLSHYNLALTYRDVYDSRWATELGYALHYFEDATCPFHAANDIHVPLLDEDHCDFERMAESSYSNYKIQNNKPCIYEQVRLSPEDSLWTVAKLAYDIYKELDLGHGNNWPEGIERALEIAQKWVSAVLYAFLLKSNSIELISLWCTTRHQTYWELFMNIICEEDQRVYHAAACDNVNNQLNILATDLPGNLYHAICSGDTTNNWESLMYCGNKDLGSIVSVACANLGGELHVLALNKAGGYNIKIWHTIHQGDKWLPFGDVINAAGYNYIEALTSIACANVNNELHVLAIDDRTNVWHTIRHTNGQWKEFSDIIVETGNKGVLTSIACANVNNELHVLATEDLIFSQNGCELWHTIRHTDGHWDLWENVIAYTGIKGVLKSVACTNVNGELHVLVTDNGGNLWHTIHHTNNQWDAFEDVKGQTGCGGIIKSVVCTNMNGELYVCAMYS